MWADIKRMWAQLRAEGHGEIETPQNKHADFLLQYEGLEIGRLTLHDGRWYFAYSDEFRRQSEVRPLLEFPDINRTYESEHLWPFFMLRIPSIAQPQVRELIKRERLDKHNPVELLNRFGRRTVANPFLLEPIAESASR